MREVLDRSFEEAEALLGAFRSSEAAMAALCEAGRMISRAFRTGHKVLAAGNGGSLADASHFCEEWTGRFRADRRPYPAIALSDGAAMSCIGNDYGFEQVFARQIEALGQVGDIALLLSTSGNSANLLAAADVAKAKGLCVIGLLGRGGGVLASKCNVVIEAPGDTADRIQEIHMLALHALIEGIEGELERD